MRQKMLLLLAVIFGLLAFMLTYKQLEHEKAKIRGSSEERILIQVKNSMVEGQEIKVTDIAPHRVRRERDSFNRSREIPWEERARVIGRRLEVTVIPGQLLQYSDLKPVTLRNGFSAIIKEQCRAVSVPVDPVSSVNNLVQPNDNVDVLGTFRFPDLRGDNSLDTVTITILQNVKVLAVGNRWGSNFSDSANAPRSYSTVTLQLYPDEVEMVIFASQKGKLSLSLRNFEDERISKDIEARSVNFKSLEKEIPKYNKRREERRRIQ